jgi:hypothetical protein
LFNLGGKILERVCADSQQRSSFLRVKIKLAQQFGALAVEQTGAEGLADDGFTDECM